MRNICLFALYILAMCVHQAKADDTLFPYPTAPDNLVTTQERCSYVVEHFWERCNLKQSLSARAKLNQAFNDFISLVVLADAEVAHKSTKELLDKMKGNPELLLTFAQMAEGIMYSDTATLMCDEIYVHYADAVAANKKIKGADKARYAAQSKILNASQVGMIAPDIEITLADGTKKHLSDFIGSYIILFFNNPDCTDCLMSRVRLSADYNINQFIKNGQLNFISIYPGDSTDEEWVGAITGMPDNWTVGASPEADTLYDLRRTPSIYYLNKEHKILSKSMTADQLINAFRAINTRNN